MAKQVTVEIEVNSSQVDQTVQKLGQLKDLGKGLKIQYDIDGKPLDVVIDKSKNLQQQVKILTAELRKTKEGTAEFSLLSTKLGDAQDQLTKTTAKSKDLFTSLSMIPGPVGQFFSQLQGGIELLKTFSSFSLKDLSFQFKETANDIADIGKNISDIDSSNIDNVEKSSSDLGDTLQNTAAQAGGTSAALSDVAKNSRNVVDASGKVTTAAENAAAASTKEGQAIAGMTTAQAANVNVTRQATAATNQLAASEATATVATNTLGAAIKGALIGTGIGLAIVLIGEIISKLISYFDSSKQAEKAADDFSDAIKRQNEILEANLGQIDFENKKKLLQAKIAGESEKELNSITQEGLENRYNLIRNANSAALLEQQNLAKRVGKYQKISDEERAALLEKNLENLKKLDIDESRAREAVELGKLQIQATAAEKSRNLSTKSSEKQVDDTKIAAQTLLDLQKENTLASIKNERDRQYKELELQAATEVDKINALKISEEKKEEIRNQIFLKYAKKQIGLKDKFNEEDLKKQEEQGQKVADYAGKLEDIRIAAIENASQKEIEQRRNKYLDDLKDLDKALKDKLINQEQYNTASKNLEQSLTNDVKKIKDDAILKEKENKLKKLDDDIKFLEISNNAQKNSFVAYWQGRQEILDKSKQRELEAEELTGAQKAAIEKKYVQLSKDLQKEKFEAYLGYVSAGLSAVSSFYSQQQTINGLAMDNELAAVKGNAEAEDKIKEKYFYKNKDAQIGQAVISTLQSAISAYSSLAVIPVVGPALGAIAAAAALVFGYRQVALIKAQKYQSGLPTAGGGGEAAKPPMANYGQNYEKGGMIGGKRHAEGGTLIEAEKGEAIMTRGAVTMFQPMLSMMNQMGGGTSFAPSLMTTSYDKPNVSTPSQEQAPIIVKSYVVSNDMTSSQEKNARLKDLSTL
jgi:hypothetical protein